MTKKTHNFRHSFPSPEYNLLESLKPFLNFKPSRTYPIGIGDDAAVRRCAKEMLVLTADALVENVHFSLDYMRLGEVGYKAMAANVSDCAAMGAVPDAALVQLMFPSQCSRPGPLIRQLYKGFSDACRKWGFPIIGGNLSRGPCWMIDIAMVGKIRRGDRVLMRKGARPGDILYVSGFPGQSAAGLAAIGRWGRKNVPRICRGLVDRHIRPVPRIELAARLARCAGVHAAIDISDGISKECATLSHENKLSIVLDERRFPRSGSMIELGRRLRVDCREWFLHGGEDYELLFAASPRFDPGPLQRALKIPLCGIGRFEKGETGVWIVEGNGKAAKLWSRAWDHVGHPRRKGGAL
jgi:thiamine-monophosphate kinase